MHDVIVVGLGPRPAYADVLQGHRTYQGLLDTMRDRLPHFIARALRETAAEAFSRPHFS